MLDKIFSTRNLVIFCIVCFTFILGFAAWIFYQIGQNHQNTATTADETNTSQELVDQRDTIGGAVTSTKMEEYKKEGLNPFGTDVKINQLTDAVYQEYIHGMSHQKVKADVKWGFYQINKERIQWLLKGLKQNKLEYEDIYRDILTRWSKGDFSEADEDHNKIWRLQGGNIGEATGLLTTEEEKAYVASKGN